jgi:hypothetical protein
MLIQNDQMSHYLVTIPYSNGKNPPSLHKFTCMCTQMQGLPEEIGNLQLCVITHPLSKWSWFGAVKLHEV